MRQVPFQNAVQKASLLFIAQPVSAPEHSLVQHLQRNPVRRVLEARSIQDQHHVGGLTVAAHRAEVAVACSIQMVM